MSETSESPQPNEPPVVPAPLPGVRFRAPGAAPRLPDEESDQLHQPAAGEGPAAPQAPASAAAAEPPAERPSSQPSRKRRPKGGVGASSPEPGRRSEGPTTTETSTTGPATDRPDEPAPAATFAEPKQLAVDIAEMLQTASYEANDRVAPGTDLLIASDEEALGVARPAARLLVRHLPAGMGGAGNPDLADAVSATIVLLRYGLRQLRRWHELRRENMGGPDHQPPADPLAA